MKIDVYIVEGSNIIMVRHEDARLGIGERNICEPRMCANTVLHYWNLGEVSRAALEEMFKEVIDTGRPSSDGYEIPTEVKEAECDSTWLPVTVVGRADRVDILTFNHEVFVAARIGMPVYLSKEIKLGNETFSEWVCLVRWSSELKQQKAKWIGK